MSIVIVVVVAEGEWVVPSIGDPIPEEESSSEDPRPTPTVVVYGGRGSFPACGQRGKEKKREGFT